MKLRYCCYVQSMMILFAGLFISTTFAQSELTKKLEKEESFYVNYGNEQFTKLKIERDVVGLYNLFGDHIVDGVHLYELSNDARVLSDEASGDSVQYSRSLEMQKDDFYQNFTNLVVTQDAIGGLKTSFIVGDQITTRFTPLTFNKTNFNGVRWDLWSTGLKLSFLASRTRPGFLAKHETDGYSLVEYPTDTLSFPKGYYNRGIRGDQDFSSKSPFGDYDMLWSIHAENTIANKFDVGLSYINHHVNDIRRIEGSPFKGYIPDSLMPDHIHFEFYDQTPEDTLDAGVYVGNVQMFVNEKPVTAKAGFESEFRNAYTGDRDGILLPRDIPLARSQNGHIPVMVEFKIDPQYWKFADDGGALQSKKQIKKVSFTYEVAGNYLVFVSTDRQIPSSISGEYNPRTRQHEYSHPSLSVGQIYDNEVKVSASGAPNTPENETNYSTTYFGEYIAQSAKRTPVRRDAFDVAINASNLGNPPSLRDPRHFNFRTYNYEFNINSSSVTYGVNFRGELAGINFTGEVALNQSEDMLPGKDDSRASTYTATGSLKANKEIGNKLGLSGEAYQIAPQWNTALEKLQASQYFSQTNYKTRSNDNSKYHPKDYQVHPRPLGDPYYTIDDNDDNDFFPENDRRRYPADLDPKQNRGDFLDDGQLSWESNEIEGVTLPSGLTIPYDDPDGVAASKNDRNRNGTDDYYEDFLLFSSDLPVFELGIDENNNGIPDYEDDDILPDYGHSVGYVITGDGFKTLGIRGGKTNLRWSLLENGYVDFGAIHERVIDRDFVLENSDDVSDPAEGLSTTLYLNGVIEVIKRSQGLQYEIGNEIRKIYDGIRNDYIDGPTRRLNEEIDVAYFYREDPLNYRDALVDNFIATVNYANIPNLEYGFKFKAGGEYHNEISQPTYTGPSLWQRYDKRLVGEFHFVKKLKYTFGFDYQFEDWRSVFNFMNRLEIVPQYKIAYHMRKELDGPDITQNDPRNLALLLRLDEDNNGHFDEPDFINDNELLADSLRDMWYTYASNNWAFLQNVPILRVNYKIAENTSLQLGAQGYRLIDPISPENNAFKFTGLGQVVSSAQYRGYSVTLNMGARYINALFDVHAKNAVLYHGSLYDIRQYEFFVKIYSGS